RPSSTTASTASVDARRPAQRGNGSRPSPSRGAAAAQPPAPAPTRSVVSSSRHALSGTPCLSLCLLAYHFSFGFLKQTTRSENFLNLPMHTARIPPVASAPATI